MTSTHSELRYDPYDFEIDSDPYPVWRRLREEQPLYYNEQYGFYALSRFADVEAGLRDWASYSSAQGTLLELIKGDFPIPPGMVIFEDPPEHRAHRTLLSRLFTPRKMAAIEPKIREFCARSLDPLVGTGRFDFITDLGAQMPMQVIGMLLGIPESDQMAIRDQIGDVLRIDAGGEQSNLELSVADWNATFDEYIQWRADHPSDDLMSELLHTEFADHLGVTRKLTRDEVLNTVHLLAAAGNETTTRLIGWAGKVLADHPDERRKLVEDRSLVPNAIEELLRFESPSPVQARLVTADVEHYGRTVASGDVMLLLNGSGNRDDRKFPDAERFDVTRSIDHHIAFGYGIHFCLGAALARLEGRVALDEVLQRFPDWQVDWEHAEQARTSTVRGWERLPVVVT